MTFCPPHLAAYNGRVMESEEGPLATSYARYPRPQAPASSGTLRFALAVAFSSIFGGAVGELYYLQMCIAAALRLPTDVADPYVSWLKPFAWFVGLGYGLLWRPGLRPSVFLAIVGGFSLAGLVGGTIARVLQIPMHLFPFLLFGVLYGLASGWAAYYAKSVGANLA